MKDNHFIQSTLRLLVVCVACLLVLASTSFTASDRLEDSVNIQFILDASLSMRSRIQGETRMDIAKDVMRELVQGLEARPGLEIALRVYGSRLTDLPRCRDSVLFQDFMPVDVGRASILALVESLEPKGMTPIAYSLERAGEDFRDRVGQNIVVLITDGLESCNGDPCGVSRRLQNEGIFLTPYVVGFALAPDEAEYLRCIGHYYEATDRESLTLSLKSIITQIVEPSVLQVAVWAENQLITDQVQLNLIDACGNSRVLPVKEFETWARYYSLPDGSYTLEALFTDGPVDLAANSDPFEISKGMVSIVELDIGSLKGILGVTARAGGVDISDRVNISLRKDGMQYLATWKDNPPYTKIDAGRYQVLVTNPLHQTESFEFTSWILPQEETWIEVDFGEQLSTLYVNVLYQGQQINGDCNVYAYRDGRLHNILEVDCSKFSYVATPGEVDILVQYKGSIYPVEKRINSVAMGPNETNHLVVELDDLLGHVKVQVIANNSNVTHSSSVDLLEFPDSLWTISPDNEWMETLLPVGSYTILAQYNRLSNQKSMQVPAGEVTYVRIEMPTVGGIKLIPKFGDLLAPIELIEAHIRRDGRYVMQMSVGDDSLFVEVPSGKYSVEGLYLTSPEQRQVAETVFVASNQVQKIEMQFVGPGSILLQLTTQSVPFTHVHYVELQQQSKPIRRLELVDSDRGLWQGDVLAGVYDVRVVSLATLRLSDVWLRNIVIQPLETSTHQIEMPGVGHLTLSVYSGGDLFGDTAAPRVFPSSNQTTSLAMNRQGDSGVWEREFIAGVYDIQVRPNIRGMEEQWLRNVVVQPGESTRLELEFGGAGTIQLTVLAGGEPFRDTNAPRVYVAGQGSSSIQLQRLSSRSIGQWSRELSSGWYDIQVRSNVRGMEEQWLRNVQVLPGVVNELSINFPGSGELRLQVLKGNTPLTEISRINVYPCQQSSSITYLTAERPRELSVWSRNMQEGCYDLEIRTRTDGIHWLRDIRVYPNQATDLEFDVKP